MNNLFPPTLICWQTRSWRKKKAAIELCKNYGLRPLLANVYLGKLSSKERKNITAAFSETFKNSTDKFSIVPLCKSCFNTIEIDAKIKHGTEHPKFEII